MTGGSLDWRMVRARLHARTAARLSARTAWERRFCESIARQPERRPLTEKQFRILEPIVDRMFSEDAELIEEIEQ